jgi:hypothetical protein
MTASAPSTEWTWLLSSSAGRRLERGLPVQRRLIVVAVMGTESVQRSMVQELNVRGRNAF